MAVFLLIDIAHEYYLNNDADLLLLLRYLRYHSKLLLKQIV